MTLQDSLDVLDRVWDRQEILAYFINVLDGESEDIFKAIKDGDELEAGRIIARAAEDVFDDLARGELETMNMREIA